MWSNVEETTQWQRSGVKPLTFRSEVHCANHDTTMPPVHHKSKLLSVCGWDYEQVST